MPQMKPVMWLIMLFSTITLIFIHISSSYFMLWKSYFKLLSPYKSWSNVDKSKYKW